MSEALFEQVREHLGPVALETTVAHGALALSIDPSSLLDVVRALKDSFGFDMFSDVF